MRNLHLTGKVIWLQTSAGTHCKAEGWCLYPLTLADSEPKEECYHSLNWVTAGKTNQMEGGVKWESSPRVGKESQWSTTPMWNAPTCLREVPTPTMEWWLYTLPSSQVKMTANQKTQSMRSCSFKQCGGCTCRPPKTLYLTIITDSRYLLPTDNGSCTYKKTLIL